MNAPAGGTRPASTGSLREWNADVYHRVSDPQRAWGTEVLSRLPLAGTELVLDVGCGTGRLTFELLQRLPRGRAIGVDLSANMIATAGRHLLPAFASHIDFVRADAASLPFAGCADAIFSTATFHWVLDHDRLFSNLYAALKPGARLVAQCGGAGNLHRLHDRCDRLMLEPRFASYFHGWQEPWEFADAATTARRLARAGFVDIRTSVEAAPILQPTRDAFVEFVTNVICRPHLARLPDAPLRDAFMEAIAALAADDTPPFQLDYWRLNIEAKRSAKCSAKC